MLLFLSSVLGESLLGVSELAPSLWCVIRFRLLHLMYFVRRNGIAIHLVRLDFEVVLNALFEAHGIDQPRCGHGSLVVQCRVLRMERRRIDAQARLGLSL